ncbi:PREDICTED: uncharacterized protein LOC107094031 [Cyprinodon variegatus]|uniref:uncharacterized protein LOC107094031 n=1 Tax=Cyprinodon variegatus TaxID=28743 RepID=UPI000742B110|nr:PREDICTED: uncharacterized protein LOC107094031 [Cyprinodon variegatus]
MMQFETYEGLPGLRQRVVSPQVLEETFVHRSDFLYSRRVTFRLDDQPLNANRPRSKLEALGVQKVVDRFHRDQSKPADKDMAQVIFLLPDWILLTYHLMDHHHIPSVVRITGKDLWSEFQVQLMAKRGSKIAWPCCGPCAVWSSPKRGPLSEASGAAVLLQAVGGHEGQERQRGPPDQRVSDGGSLLLLPQVENFLASREQQGKPKMDWKQKVTFRGRKPSPEAERHLRKRL